jgi:polysaccharide export outer membrane protein
VVSEPTVIPVSLGGPHAVADTDGPYLLDSGDKLRIFVYGQPNLSRLYTVDHGGAISMPLIGRVPARGLTTYGLESRIKRRLGAKYVRDPEVTVDIAQNRPFFILGEVRAAGQYPYVDGMTVQTAVAIAGGYSERANKRNIQITRRINGLVEKLDVPGDYVIKPGDTLLVHERFF